LSKKIKGSSLSLVMVLLVLSLSATTIFAQAGKQDKEIARGVFVFYGFGSSLWYLPTEETSGYCWAPEYK